MEKEESNHRWHILWSPSGFGSSTVRLIDLWSAVRKIDDKAEIYFPTYQDRVRDREVMIPLFPNYVFVFCNNLIVSVVEERLRQAGSAFMSFLCQMGKTTYYEMQEEELDRIKEALKERVNFVQEWWHVGDFVVGDEVSVRNMPGIAGKILYFLPPTRAMIETQLFNKPTPVPVKVADLQQLGER